MRTLFLIAISFTLCISCSKSDPKPTPATPTTPTTPATPITPGTPATPDTLPPPIRLYNPVPLDTLYDWVRIGRVTYTLLDICFTSNSTGFITNDSSLFVTHDNGYTWEKIPNTDYVNIWNLQFIDNQNGFIEGANMLGITRDGGTTWVFKSLPTVSAVYFQFVNKTAGFIGDADRGIRKTLDAGDHWTSISGAAQRSFPFYFLDSLTGFSMTGGNFSKSTNGGLNWVLKTANVMSSGQGYFKMQFIDTSIGYCATPDGLLKTTNGGMSWVNSLPSSTHYMIPYFLDANNGYCLDNNIIYKTTDGGLNWRISCQLTGDVFSGFNFLDMNTGWASTFGGFILRLK